MKKNDVRRWLKADGGAFLRNIGIKDGQDVLDFGCGNGHYTIPALKVVGGKGKVYAAEKEKGSRDKLAKKARAYGLRNLKVIDTKGGLNTGLKEGALDAVLLYDVLHYFDKRGRRFLFREVFMALKAGGILSVYPKHCKGDEPLWNLRNIDSRGIRGEIERERFRFVSTLETELMHDEGCCRGVILNFRRQKLSASRGNLGEKFHGH